MSDAAKTSERVEEILASVPIFSRLNNRDVKKLARLCVPKTFDELETIIEEGATGLGMFVITSGRAEVFKGKGDTRLSLGAMEEGDVLGEIALIDNQPRSASAVAQTETECLLLTRDSFETLVKKEPEIAWCIVPSLAERVRELHGRALEAEERLAQGEAASRPEKRETTADSAAAASESESVTDSDGEDEATSEAWETMARSMRMPYGLMVGGLTGMTAMVKMWETFFTKLADETELRDSDTFSEVMDKAPDGVVAASRATISELEKVPQDMVDSFQRIYKDD
ncbi:MAG: cyclic nucleotide-binding domain-containing protein [Acidobacteriota bacterium]|nr:cyclic nucleotide-binding domain-containing protein [Acidobacteriota bacterium]